MRQAIEAAGMNCLKYMDYIMNYDLWDQRNLERSLLFKSEGYLILVVDL